MKVFKPINHFIKCEQELKPSISFFLLSPSKNELRKKIMSLTDSKAHYGIKLAKILRFLSYV